MRDTLVTYASRAGATAEIAHVIAAQLRQDGLSIDCCEIREVHSLDRYGAVVIGSAVYAGQWMHPARAFLRHHRQVLEHRPLWAFSSGPVGAPRPGQTGHDSTTEPKRIIKELQRLGVRDHIAFGGRIPDPPHGMIARAIARNTPEQYHDCRDWGAIRDWAHTIAITLGAETQADTGEPPRCPESRAEVDTSSLVGEPVAV